MNRSLALLFFVAGCTGKTSPTSDAGRTPFVYPEDDRWTLFDTQSKATHNSYHLQGDVDTLVWNYSHVPLDVQADTQGVRAFELDVHDEPDAGRLAVYHVGLVDYSTTCSTFRECISVIQRWSDAHPAHLPLFIQVEPKDTRPPSELEGFFTAVEADIRDVFGMDHLITPAMVQGNEPTLSSGVRMHGWPTLRQARGKVMFAWDDGSEVRRVYSRDGTDLTGRLMFVDAQPGEPLAAIAVRNDPIVQADAIAAALAAGMLVRTRADEDGVQPSVNDRTRLEAALASGAHFISTDYPRPVPDAGIIYDMQIPGGTPSRCNPVTTAATTCTATALEDPASL